MSPSTTDDAVAALLHEAAETHHQQRHQVAQHGTDRHDNQHQPRSLAAIGTRYPRSGRRGHVAE